MIAQALATDEKEKKEEESGPFTLNDLALDIDDAESTEESDGNSSDEDQPVNPEQSRQPLHVLPLYAMLSTSAQLKVFEPPPEGERLVVVATNIAETSLTIPGIKYVIDSGRQKERQYDLSTGISKFEVEWISQASANQRAGRAGRTEKGHCYRLYSSALFNNEFPEFAKPEVERLPMDGMVLSMKSMGIENLTQFPFPSPPDPTAIQQATKHLVSLGALSNDSAQIITDLGRSIAMIPIAPRYGKMLVLGHQGHCLPYVIALVAMLAVRDPIMLGSHESKTEFAPGQHMQKKGAWKNVDSDLLGSLRAVGAYEYGGASETFCESNGLHAKTMKEIHDLRLQLCRILRSMSVDGFSVVVVDDWNLGPPTSSQEQLLQQIIIAGLIDQVARRIPTDTILENPELQKGYIGCSNRIPCWIHSQSDVGKRGLPEYVAYQDIVVGKRASMRGVTAVPPEWIYRLGATMCTASNPMQEPAPWYDVKTHSLMCFVKPQFGLHAWELPAAPVPLPKSYNERYHIFARLLLEGKVCPGLKAFVPHLKAKPSILMRQDAQPRVVSLVRSLRTKQIDSLPALEQEWNQNRLFLLEVYVLWVQSAQHKQLRSVWPPISNKQSKKIFSGE